MVLFQIEVVVKDTILLVTKRTLNNSLPMYFASIKEVKNSYEYNINLFQESQKLTNQKILVWKKPKLKVRKKKVKSLAKIDFLGLFSYKPNVLIEINIYDPLFLKICNDKLEETREKFNQLSRSFGYIKTTHYL